MKEKLLLIDGHSILNRAFYGVPMLTASDGVHTNAVYGFLNMMFKVIEEEAPQYLTVAFDVHAPTFRHKIYDAYKGTRKSMPEELREQVPLIREVLGAMQIPVQELEGYEADDILGTLSVLGEKAGMEVTVLSGDRDLLQLATDTVRIRIPKTSKGQTEVFDYYAEDVKKEYGVTPEEFIDLKALMGDASDNIPGIPGVGIKTAAKIIQQFHSIENAYGHADEIRPKKAMESIKEHFDLAVLSKDLARIRLDAPVTLDPEKARCGQFYTPEAYALFKRLGFRNLLGKFEEEAQPQAGLPEIRVITEKESAEEALGSAVVAEKAAVAILQEEGQILGTGICTQGDKPVYIALSEEIDAAFLADCLKSLLGRDGMTAVFGLKEMLRDVPVPENEALFDVQIGWYLLDPLRSEYPYDMMASEFANILLPSPQEVFNSKKIPAARDMELQPAAAYVCWQAYAALCSVDTIGSELEKNHLLDLFREIEMPLVFTLADMERAGIRVNKEELEEYGNALGGQIQDLEEKIYSAAGQKFNIQSPKQLGTILFEEMKLPGGKKTKTGYSTAADVLEKLAPDVPFVKDILTYRQLTKLKSTYADALGNFIREDGRIHSNFNQTITATGRISSNEPNLQNIPVRMEIGRRIRKVFVPEEGNIFVDADYSQIELRVLAALSGDEKLIDAYRQAKDIHRITASQVFHVPFDEVTDLQRRNAKAVNFGIVYGISSFGLSQDLSVSRKEAAEYIEHYFETYPSIKNYLDGLVESAKKTGYSLTAFGRKRPVPELSSSNFMQRSFGERVAMNAPIQGTAADIIKIAMNRVSRRLKKEMPDARLLLQVHDELLIEAPQEKADEVSALLGEEMVHAASLAVELAVDIHTGHSWYEAK